MFAINEGTYKPKTKKKKMVWEKKLYLGAEIELEYEIQDSYEKKVKSAKNIYNKIKESKKDNIFYYKNDGSLRNGIEIVSHPFTKQYAHYNIDFYKLFEEINKNNFIPNNRCGIHVHLSKNFFTSYETKKLRLFFSINKKEIFKFSGRDSMNKEYCRWEGFTAKQFLKGEVSTQGNRYFALALQSQNIENGEDNSKTIEIRAFASTNKHKKFISILQFCEAISYFVKDISIATISKSNGKSWEAFIDWCEKTNRYNHFLDEIGI